MRKNRFSKKLIALLICFFTVGTLIEPVNPVFAADSSDEINVETTESDPAVPESETAPVEASDETVQAGEIKDIAAWMNGIDYSSENETVEYTGSQPAFDSDKAGVYSVEYRVTPKNGKDSYLISRKITVEAAPASDQGTEGSAEDAASTEENAGQDSADPLPGTENEGESSEEPIDDEADAELVKASNIAITADKEYYYSTYGMGTYVTRRYRVVKDGSTYYAYCSQPSKAGPTGSNAIGSLQDMATDSILSKILYYGADALNPMTSPSGSASFFEQAAYKKYNEGQRFIITHLALGLEDNDSNWNKGASAEAQNAARALVAFARNSSLPTVPVEKPSISYSGEEIHDSANKTVKSQIITFNANPEFTTTFTLPAQVSFEQISGKDAVVKGNEVTVYGGTSFRLSAPEDAKNINIDETLTTTGTYSTYGAKRFVPTNQTSFQNLAILFPTVDTETYSMELRVSWLHRSSVSILKTDEDGNPVAGAELQLRDADGRVLDTWTSTDQPKVYDSSFLNPGQTYSVKETKAPSGYVLNTEAKTFVMPSVTTAQPEMIEVQFENARNQIEITKTDITGEKELAGAVLSVLDENGNVVELKGEALTWTSTEEAHVIRGLPSGKYILREDTAPAGYVKTTDVEFEVVDGVPVTQVVMKDELTKLQIQKISALTEKPLAGARLEIFEADGTTPAKDVNGNTYSFLSDEDPKDITGLPFGEYILRETETPAGYATAEDVKFTVSEETQNQTVKMVDEPIQVSFSKTDITTGEELPGATLSILDKDGNVVELNGEKLTWVSTDEKKIIPLLPVGDYILREEIAPAGYVVANDVEFTVTDTREIQGVVMEDDVTRVSLEKLSSLTGERLEGAVLVITDQDGNVMKGPDGQDLRFESGSEAITVTHLPYGKYLLKEEKAPAGYATAEDVEFELNEENFHISVSMTDDPIQVSFSKTDITTGEELPGATLSILDKDGNVVELNGEKLTWVSTDEKKIIPLLPAGDYILREEIAPAGYVIAEDVPFTVTDTNEIQMVVMEDDYTKVDVVKTDPEGKLLEGAKLRLSDAESNVIEEFTSEGKAYRFDRLPEGKYTLTELEAPKGYQLAEPVEFTVKATGEVQTVTMVDEPEKTPATPGTPSKPSNKKPANTATDSNAALWLTLFGAAIVVLAILFLLRKKKK